MLSHLHVKDMALIDSSDVEFGEGLNILTGETGAGKSILIGSINLALGSKANKDMIRSGKDSGAVELVFTELTEQQERALREMDVEPEDGMLIIRRKISERKSEIRINDRISTLSKLREVTELLIDIHGQHEHQSLLRDGSHLRILDSFLYRDAGGLRQSVRTAYRSYREAWERLCAFDLDEGQRQREIDFLEFEIRELTEAELREGEEEELSERYRRYQNSEKIRDAVSEAGQILGESELFRAVGLLERAVRYDEGLKGVLDSLYDLQAIAEDSARELRHYLEQNEYSEEEFRATEKRLNLIRGILVKYGDTVERAEAALLEKKRRLQELLDYDSSKKKAEEAFSQARQELLLLSGELTKKREEGAAILCRRIAQEMQELGFLSTRFEMSFRALREPTENGMDEAHFEVSLNPGEPVRPLSEVASGGELSRIMLSIKTVLADGDEIPTLIFDEVDTGISGRTAEKVAEKLRKISRNHQVILITHLPQIAAKADRHYGIEKSAADGHTHTEIRELSEEESVLELGRLLAGDRLTAAVLENARELKALAKKSE
ncbi:MAG: DNA repair protein RecN [Oribacterium sp.]